MIRLRGSCDDRLFDDFVKETSCTSERGVSTLTFPFPVIVESATADRAPVEIFCAYEETWKAFKPMSEAVRLGVSHGRPTAGYALRATATAAAIHVEISAECLAVKLLADSLGFEFRTSAIGPPDRQGNQTYRFLNTAAARELQALAISCPSGRFGNNFRQLLNAIAVARNVNVGKLYVPELRLFDVPDGRIRLDGIEVVAYDTRHDITEPTLFGKFFSQRSLGNLMEASRDTQHIVEAFIAPLFVPLRRAKARPSHHVAIHIRAGDLFDRPNPHPRYPQPPLAFYRQVLEHFMSTYESPVVTLIFEDRGNPVVDALEEFLRAQDRQYVAQSSTLEEDMLVLLEHQTLVLGRGTFGKAVARLSQNVRRLYFPWTDSDFQSIVEDRRLDGFTATEREPLGIPIGGWKNTPEQRRLMIEYPASNLVIASA